VYLTICRRINVNVPHCVGYQKTRVGVGVAKNNIRSLKRPLPLLREGSPDTTFSDPVVTYMYAPVCEESPVSDVTRAVTSVRVI
jgi:hypothetical protein